MRHHAWMQANAVSQRAAWVLLPRPLNYRLSDAVSMGGRRRNGGASVSGVDRGHEASETLTPLGGFQTPFFAVAPMPPRLSDRGAT